MGLREQEVIGQVRDALAKEPTIEAPRITISMLEPGQLALSGVVDTAEQVKRAEQVARQAAPGVAIDNSLTVGLNPHGMQDSQLQPLVEARLAEVRDRIRTRPARVNVQVEHGIAKLRGRVSTMDDRDTLINEVAEVPGIRRIDADRLGIAWFGTADDVRLGNLVEERLQKELPELATTVRVRVHNRGAHVMGWVREARQLEQVMAVIKQQPGLKELHDELEVRQEGALPGSSYAREREIKRAWGQADLPVPDMMVFIEDGVAFLYGEVQTPEQQLRAAQLASERLGDGQIVNNLHASERVGEAPHQDSKLLQHSPHPKNTPNIPLEHASAPDAHNKMKHTGPLEDRVPELDRPMPKQRHD